MSIFSLSFLVLLLLGLSSLIMSISSGELSDEEVDGDERAGNNGRLLASAANGAFSGDTVATISKKKAPKYSCADKEDDGHYEHIDCKKYWHCLYVGTIFEYALERKCPIGTMFHPLQRVCEISTVVISEHLFFFFSFFILYKLLFK